MWVLCDSQADLHPVDLDRSPDRSPVSPVNSESSGVYADLGEQMDLVRSWSRCVSNAFHTFLVHIAFISRTYRIDILYPFQTL